jgi:hypothetical protein
MCWVVWQFSRCASPRNSKTAIVQYAQLKLPERNEGRRLTQKEWAASLLMRGDGLCTSAPTLNERQKKETPPCSSLVKQNVLGSASDLSSSAHDIITNVPHLKLPTTSSASPFLTCQAPPCWVCSHLYWNFNWSSVMPPARYRRSTSFTYWLFRRPITWVVSPGRFVFHTKTGTTVP